MSVQNGNFRRYHEVLHDNASLGNGSSTVATRISDLSKVEIYGTNTTASGTLTLEYSQDNQTWYSSSNQLITVAGADFHGYFDIAAEYVRVRANQAMVGLTVIISGKQ